MARAFRILAALAVLIGFAWSHAHAQVPLTGAGRGAPGGGAVAFSGSGDVLAGAFAYWSCARAYTAAYASGAGNACDIIRASDSATCTTKFNSTGFLDVTTAYCNSSTQNVTAFCNATTCAVSKAYDQSGATNCTTACDATQAGAFGAKPVLNLSGLGGKVCMTFAAGQELDSPTVSNPAAQPVSGSFVSERTGSFTSFSDIVGTTAANFQFLYNSSANQGGIYAGTIGAAQQVSMTDSAYHALNMVFNGASSIVVVDGAATTGLSPGTAGLTATVLILGNGNNQLIGSFCEGRLDTGIAYSPTQYGNLNTNAHGSSGYSF